jgi:hypothetical protein
MFVVLIGAPRSFKLPAAKHCAVCPPVAPGWPEELSVRMGS